ncbi:MAG: hypothetical protein K2L13_03020 [Opitutales bacterium]|nr:hypothetical protein [Opitutales bacterium]
MKQFFEDNGVLNFEDRAIIVDDGAAIKLSYDANSTSENDGISMCTLKYNFSMNYGLSKLNVNFLENGDVCLSYDQNNKVATFKMRDLRNLVNLLRETANSHNSAQEGVPINQFFKQENAVQRWLNDDLYIKLNQSINPQFYSVLITRYGDSCVNLMMTASSWQKFFTQNVRIRDNPHSDVVEISGQYWDKNEKRWKNFNNVAVNRAQLLQYKNGDKTVPNRPTTIKLVNFLLRNNALPPEDQTRTLTATQLDDPNGKGNNKAVQIEINSNSDVHVDDKTLKNIRIYRDKFCKGGEAIIFGFDGRYNSYGYKVKIDDLLGHSTSLKEKSLSKESNAQVSEDHASVADNKENKTNDTNSVPKSHKPKSGKKNNYNLENLPEKGVSFGDFLEGKDKIFTDQYSENFEATSKHSGHGDYSTMLRFYRDDDTIVLEEEKKGEWKKVSSSDQSFKLFPVKSDQDADKNKIKFRFGPNTNNRNRSFEVDKDTLQQILFPESNSAE